MPRECDNVHSRLAPQTLSEQHGRGVVACLSSFLLDGRCWHVIACDRLHVTPGFAHMSRGPLLHRNGAFYAQSGSTFSISNSQFLYNVSPDGAGGAAVTQIGCTAGYDMFQLSPWHIPACSVSGVQSLTTAHV